MFKSNIVKLIICILVTMVVSACSNSETIGDIATNVYVSNNYKSPTIENEPIKTNETKTNDKKEKSIIIDQSQNESVSDEEKTTASSQKRRFFSWLLGSHKAKKVNDSTINETEESSDSSKTVIIDHSNNINSSKVVDNVVEANVETNIVAEGKKGSFFKRMWCCILNFNKGGCYKDNYTRYKVDSLSTENDLTIVPLKIPKSDNLEVKPIIPNKKFVETKNTVKENIKDKNELYSGFNILDFTDESNLLTNKENNEIEDQYLDYIVSLKYEGSISNYNNLNPIISLTSEHKQLINQLLQKDYNVPKILYVIFRNINTIKDNSSVNNQLYLTSYLNVIRAYIYTKKVKNIFVQEVQYKDLPVNEILLITKPLSFEQFRDLPKQVNFYNAPKVSNKEWLDSLKKLDQKAKERQQKLYDQAEGK